MSNRAVAKKIGENKTVVEKKKSTQKSSTGLKITEKRGRQKEKRGNRGVKKHHYCGYTERFSYLWWKRFNRRQRYINN